jgi:hypothetical protein
MHCLDEGAAMIEFVLIASLSEIGGVSRMQYACPNWLLDDGSPNWLEDGPQNWIDRRVFLARNLPMGNAISPRGDS